MDLKFHVLTIIVGNLGPMCNFNWSFANFPQMLGNWLLCQSGLDMHDLGTLVRLVDD